MLLYLGVFALVFVWLAIPRRKGPCAHCGKELWTIYPHGTMNHRLRSGLFTWQCEDGTFCYRRSDTEVEP